MKYDSVSTRLDLTLGHELDFMLLSKDISYNLRASLSSISQTQFFLS